MEFFDSSASRLDKPTKCGSELKGHRGMDLEFRGVHCTGHAASSVALRQRASQNDDGRVADGHARGDPAERAPTWGSILLH